MSFPSEFTEDFFDESSKRWKENKVYIGTGTYKYKKNAFPKEDLPKQPKPALKIKLPPVVEKEPPILRRSPRLRQSKFMKREE